jgi:4-hydroxy-tetrahydrodipicolinate synthase
MPPRGNRAAARPVLKAFATLTERRYRMLMFRGTFTALVTPFQNGAIDFPALEKLIEAQIAAGIDGLVAVGTTGESPTLSHEEKEQIIRFIIEKAKSHCLVFAGTGSYSTRDAVAATQAAEKFGADGALVVAPYYNRPSQEGLFRHFQAIAKATSLPLMLYNIPPRCAVDIGAETVARLQSDCSNIVSIKEASGSVDRIADLRRRLPEEFTVLSGDDGLTLPFMAVGAAGVVSVASNLLPGQVCQLVRAFASGDIKGAQQLHQRLYRLFKDLFIEPNPVPVKTAMSWCGMISADVRLPLCEMMEANQARLRETLDEFGREQ